LVTTLQELVIQQENPKRELCLLKNKSNRTCVIT